MIIFLTQLINIATERNVEDILNFFENWLNPKDLKMCPLDYTSEDVTCLLRDLFRTRQ